MKNIELKSVVELLEEKKEFYIPSYQRGYRWTAQQVRDLLNDVGAFMPQKLDDNGEASWYCLQPLVVSPRGTGQYEVIDGQQRLTTIFIILKCLQGQDDCKSSFSLAYATRPNSGVFLDTISSKGEQDDTNIDFHFMLEAKGAIEEWKKAKTDSEISSFIDKLKNHCKVIWYVTSYNAYKVFKRLNSGKISLSNAELIKALLLNRDNFGDDISSEEIELRQLEMAGEWDRIEQSLHDDSFWYFINPDPESSKYNSTRIDFLFEMALLRRTDVLRTKEDGVKHLEDELAKNKYYIFGVYSESVQSSSSEGVKKIWDELILTYRTFKSWYDNRELYHYVGYLVNQKGNAKIEILGALLADSAHKGKTEFLKDVICKCRKSILGKEKELDVSELTYGKNNETIHNILLLFNLATTQNQVSEQSRYPFDKHYQAAKKKWSLEHIHAQNEKKPDLSVDDVRKIVGYLASVASTKADVKSLVEKIEADHYTIANDDMYRAVVGALMGHEVKRNGDGGFTSDFEKDDSLRNLALLQGDKNASLNNKLYPEKKEKLAEWENATKEKPSEEKQTEEERFVPICTRNVFFKHYSPKSTNPLLWDEEAGREYLNAMIKTVASYLRLEATPKDGDKTGLELKGE